MNTEKFWSMLTQENKERVEKLLINYKGSDGYVGRIYELYEEGATAISLSVEDYMEEISPNEYVECLWEKMF